jgi:uncharacterized protein YjiS (DUF1127 family)
VIIKLQAAFKKKDKALEALTSKQLVDIEINKPDIKKKLSKHKS